MTEHVDFRFLDKPLAPPSPMQRYHEVLREALRRKICMSQNDMEEAVERARHLIRAHQNVADELNEMEVFANGLLLQVALFKREIGKPE